MTQISRPWGGIVTGDAGPYSDDQWSDMYNHFFALDRTNEGVFFGILNNLNVTGVASPVAVASGAAVVDGKYYLSDASENVIIPTPAGATRIDRIVLRKSWAAQTVRITRIAGAEGGAAPAITQLDGTTWDITLAQASITVPGVITVTDERKVAGSPAGRLYAPGNQLMTIAAGVANPSSRGSFFRIDTEAAAASDDLDTITGTFTGHEIIIRIENNARRVRVKHATGNILLPNGADFDLSLTNILLRLRYDGTDWYASGGGGGGPLNMVQVRVFS